MWWKRSWNNASLLAGEPCLVCVWPGWKGVIFRTSSWDEGCRMHYSICREVWDHLGAPNESPPSVKSGHQPEQPERAEDMKQPTLERTANRCSPECHLGPLRVIRLSPRQCSVYYTTLHIWKSKGLKWEIQSRRFVNTRRLLKWEQTGALYSELAWATQSATILDLEDTQTGRGVGSFVVKERSGGRLPVALIAGHWCGKLEAAN